ncbi:hypothetical protein LQ948_05420 [Jiella sp. MQZ9-1]|uniref:Pyrrolidone-carboxylate peptidase n=1 Tax=Jiella flava TaxID=2816857 RepID=A0A939JRL5_9HYPH|nr:hypothetical protein [Jiella flava]MBO0662028.1 hypothetical protein [Jiella flava]MCD2470645.1 hypothetical protein [Jiella flava]
MSILAVGFAAFPGVARNPSETLMRQLEAKIQGAGVTTLVLPVAWDESWPALKTAISRMRASTVLLFGAHLRAERFRVELQARNRRELGRADALGAFPAGPAIGDGPATLPCRLDWLRLARTLRAAGIDFEWSSNAGSYLCNDTLYRLALAADGLGIERFGFFHLPSSDEGVADLLVEPALPEVFMSLPLDRLEAAALAILAACGYEPSTDV